MTVYPELQSYIDRLAGGFSQISAERKALLTILATYIQRNRNTGPGRCLLNFICTHNSRRSQISQIWMATALHYYGIDKVHAYSGGTEVTAFNPRAVAALQRTGFRLEKSEGSNPHYFVRFSDGAKSIDCFSKVYDDAVNPQHDFAAIMTCSEADDNCPFIPGADWRLSLTYRDPKEADDTPLEQSTYDARVEEIGKEIFFAVQLVKSKSTRPRLD